MPAHVLTASLFERFASRGEDDFQNRVLSAMRFGFGGHVEKKVNDEETEPRSDALVFFGATGDLAYKKIFPALQAMARRGTPGLPGDRRGQVGLDAASSSSSGRGPA